MIQSAAFEYVETESRPYDIVGLGRQGVGTTLRSSGGILKAENCPVLLCNEITNSHLI